MPRHFLNQGVHIADLNVAAGSVPEAAPSLATHGYPTAHTMDGLNIDLPVVLVVVDFVGGASPTADLNLWGYAQPPTAGATLVNDWQLIDTVTVSDSVGTNPTFAIVPCAGFLRFDVKVNAIGGAPTSVRMRLIGTTHYTSDLMIAAGAVAGVASKVDIIEVAGNSVATTGINGTMPIEGTQATGTTLNASYPISIGGEVVQVPVTKTDGDFENVILDLERFVRTASKAFDSLTYSDKISNLNTSATDHGYFLIADETNITQPATQYYPSSAGHVIGNRVNITILLVIEDITSVGFEFTNDPTLTNWEDITATVLDPNTGINLYAPTHWSEPGSGTPIVMSMHIRGVNAGSFRLAVVGSAAANTFEAYGYAGAL